MSSGAEVALQALEKLDRAQVEQASEMKALHEENRRLRQDLDASRQEAAELKVAVAVAGERFTALVKTVERLEGAAEGNGFDQRIRDLEQSNSRNAGISGVVAGLASIIISAIVAYFVGGA